MADKDRITLEDVERGVYVRLNCGCVVLRTSPHTIDKPAHFYRVPGQSRVTRAACKAVHVEPVIRCSRFGAHKRFKAIHERPGKPRRWSSLDTSFGSDKKDVSSGRGIKCKVARSAATRQYYVFAEESGRIEDQLAMQLAAQFSKKKS